MVIFRYIIQLLFLTGILYFQGSAGSGESQETKNIYIAFDLVSGELLFQAYGPGVSGNYINLYRELEGFHTTSIRSMNRNGDQYTELVFKADNTDDPEILEQVFTFFLARKCTLIYDGENDTLNLLVNDVNGLQINSHNGRDLLQPVDNSIPMLMLVWPGDTVIFEIEATIN